MTLTLEPTTTSTLEGAPVIHEGGSSHPDALDTVERELFDSWLTLIHSPPEVEVEVPSTSRRLREIGEWTDWSNRRLAEILNTTHPTIAGILSGRDAVRVPNLSERVARMHSVVERISLLCDQEVSEVRRLLESHPDDGASAVDLMTNGAYARAYLTALDLRTSPLSEGLMGAGLTVKRPGSVSIESFDE